MRRHLNGQHSEYRGDEMITRGREQPLDVKLINDCIKQFDNDAKRRAKLYAYYLGQHDINGRIRTAGLPNNKIVHNYPHYIATVTSGYLIGDPVQYADGKQEAALEAVLDAYNAADVQSIDAELALNQAIYGRGIELCYADSQARPRTTSISPEHAFVVYDDTAEAQPMFGVHRLTGTDEQGNAYYKRITVYTLADVLEYEADTKGMATKLSKQYRHNFGLVPMVEYWNNSAELGDFEPVISLIDAYNVLESDRINDKEQFADALLVITGVAGFGAPDDGDKRTAAQRLREDRALALPDTGAKAEYLIKTMHESDTDILRAAIREDIHKFSYVPDLADQNFAGNSSGVAMRYKLFGLEQMTKIKERWFREGLRWRLRLFSNFTALKGAAKLDPDAVQMSFRRSLPVNDTEIAQMVATLQGIVPDNLLLAQVPFVEDVTGAIDDLAKQKKENIAAQAAAFGAFPDANNGDEDEE